MDNNSKETVTSYRWLILAITWFSFFSLTMSWYVMPTLEHNLVEMYGITSSQYSMALTIPFLVGGVLALAGGLLADHMGIRKTATMAMIIGGVGIILRSNVGGYMSLLLPMMLLGVGVGLLMPNLPKLVSAWFPPEETALATGIYNTGMMAGLSTGLVVAGFLPGWSTGNIILGIIILVFGVLFFAIVRDAPPGKELPPSNLIEGVKAALSSKSIWLAGIAGSFGFAGMVSYQGVLPGALNKVYGVPMATGGQVASMLTYLGIAGSLLLPAFADKFDCRKLFMFILPIAFAVIMFSTWLMAGNIGILWAGASIAGFLAGGLVPLAMEVPVLLPYVKGDPVKQQHIGGASGLLSSLLYIGGFVGLPFIVMPVITSAGFTKGFLVAAIMFGLGAVFFPFVRLPGQE